MTTIDLSEREIAVLRSALESAEYWEHQDDLPHNNGYILDPEPGSEEEESEAWEEVLELRALDERLAQLQDLDDEITREGRAMAAGGLI